MKALFTPRLVPAGLALLVACHNPPTGESPAELVVVQAPPSAGVPGWVLIDTIKVRLVDLAGNPKPGAPLTWTIMKGYGNVTEINATTDAEGISAALWTLGEGSGLNEVRVSTLDDSFVTFQATGEAFRVDRLASGSSMGCGLVGGTLWCWGRGFWANTPPPADRDEFGWLNLSPGLVDATRDFIDVAVGLFSVCGLDDQGEVWCASENAQQMVSTSGLPPIQRVVGAGLSEHYCGLAVSDSTAWCWQPGAPAVQVQGSPSFTGLWMEGGSQQITTCGLRVDSTAACWGDGPLGDGSSSSSDTPVSVSGHQFLELAVGVRFACGRKAGGDVWCWGKDYHEFGTPDSDILNPTMVTAGAYQITAGNVWAQMLSAGPTVRWAGAGYSPVSWPSGLTGLPVVGFATNDLSCARLVDGQVYCISEMFDRSSVPREDNYAPIQPLRTAP